MALSPAIATPSPWRVRLSWWALYALGFALIAAVSGLIAWAAAMGEDTAARRALAIPRASLTIEAQALQQALAAIVTPKMPEPIEVPNLNPGESPGLATPSPNNTVPDNAPAWKKNASTLALPGDNKPKIALIVSGLGLRPADTDLALAKLPAAITVAFSPYGQNIEPMITIARQANREVLIELPLEPLYYPSNDPGNLGLLVDAAEAQNQARLQSVTKSAGAAVGFLAAMGGKFLTSDPALRPVLQSIQSMGLLFVDNGAAMNSQSLRLGKELRTPVLQVTLPLDTEPSRRAILNQLQKLEQQALASGFAIGLAQNYPISIELITAWAAGLEQKGIHLQPLTRLVDQQIQ